MHPITRVSLALAVCAGLAACAGPSREVRVSQGPEIQGQAWRLVGTSSGDKVPGSGAGSATLEFKRDRFSLSGPCNQHSGGYSREGNEIRFGGEGRQVASTMRACPGELMARESALLSAMSQPLQLVFEGPYLSLVAADGASWRFDSRPEQPSAEGVDRIVQIAGQRAPCTGVAQGLCLQYRSQPGAPWELLHGEIEGFEWQVGVEYVLRIREYSVANPPADASSRRWMLLEVLDRSRP